MSTFIIRNKQTLEQWTASSGKSSWRKINHAKAAFAYSRGWQKQDVLLLHYFDNLGKYGSLKFNDQDVYEVVELLSDSEDKLKLVTNLVTNYYHNLTVLLDPCTVLEDIATILEVK